MLPKERTANRIMTAASTRGASFSSFDRAAANNNGLAVGAAAQMKAKKRGIEAETELAS